MRIGGRQPPTTVATECDSPPRAARSRSPAGSAATSRATTTPSESGDRDGQAARPRRGPGSPPSADAEGPPTQPPARYTEATLVKALEELGIGRPSTYASIMQTIQDRGYVWKKGQALVPTTDAFAVVNLLEEHFGRLVDYAFTARMEDDLDEIAGGRQQQAPWLHRFWFGNGDAPWPEALKAALEGGRRRGDQLDPARDGQRRRADRRPQRPLRAVPRSGRGHRQRSPRTCPSTSSPSTRAVEILGRPQGRRALGTDPDRAPGPPARAASGPTCSSATPTRRPTRSPRRRRSSRHDPRPPSRSRRRSRPAEPAAPVGADPADGGEITPPERPVRAVPEEGLRDPEPGGRGAALHDHARRVPRRSWPSPRLGAPPGAGSPAPAR